MIRKWGGKVYSTLINLYEHMIAKQCEVSVGDIVLQRAEFDHCQFLLTTRRLDVAAYINKGDKTFPYQNTVSRAVYDASHKEERGNLHFISLIESYKEKGYDSASLLTVDRECRLIDGSHRMGVNLLMGIEKLNVRMFRRSSGFPRNLDGYFKLGLTTSFMNEVVKEYHGIQNWLLETGNTFCCLIRGEYENNEVSLVKEMGLIANVCKASTVRGLGNYWGVFCNCNLTSLPIT